jgi:peptide subunit release factor 1 (eRF1)
MTEAILRDVQVLLDHPKGEGMIVSCYADTSLAVGFQSFWSQRLKNEVAQVEQRLAGDHPARLRFNRDVAVIRHALEDPAVQGTRGMAVFSAAERQFLQAFPLSVPVKDRLVLDEAPYLVPLLEAMHRQRRYLVVLSDSHRGRVYDTGWGRAHLIKEIDEAVPRHQRSSGELWGKQQATIARHREDHILHYRKELAREIENVWPDVPFKGLILLGDNETIAALRATLPPFLASRVIHSGPHSWAGKQPTINAEVQAVLDENLRAHDARLVEEMERRLREHYLVVAGPQEVINALRNGQVGALGYIVLEPDRGEMAARCTRCESVFTTMHTTCPFCQGTCEKVNLWQEIFRFAARHNIAMHTVDSNAELSRHGGVAAVLSRQEPWGPAAAESTTKTG